MKKLITTLLAALIALAAFAVEPQIRDINIKCSLDSLGSAHITEVWDVCVASGTEWYLVRNNLGDIEIKDLAVWSDSTAFVNEGVWNVDRTIDQKAGRCGINYTGSGCEICWGVGSYGDHVFTVSYTMTNAVKSLNDYDMLHIQFISDELSSCPEHARVEVSVPGVQIDTTNARMWGFGYIGDTGFQDGKMVCESTEQFQYRSSMIMLARLDKGIVADPQSIQERDFQDALDVAMSGTSFYDDDDDDDIGIVGKIITFIIVGIAFLFNGGFILLLPFFLIGDAIATRKHMLGTLNKKSILWTREPPFNGNLITSSYVLGKVGESGRCNQLTAAMILKMICSGGIEIRKDAEGKVELALKDRDAVEGWDQLYVDLWVMMYEASGKDHILQENEFRTWSKSHQGKVAKWATAIKSKGKNDFERQPYQIAGKTTDVGRAECRKAIGFKHFLKDFTMIKERASQEVIMWQDYLAYGALFGIADKVAKELKEINPEALAGINNFDASTMSSVTIMSRDLANSITRASVPSSHSGGGGYHGSSGGYGGHSSFGGGGGFSGGGHGGGSR